MWVVIILILIVINGVIDLPNWSCMQRDSRLRHCCLELLVRRFEILRSASYIRHIHQYVMHKEPENCWMGFRESWCWIILRKIAQPFLFSFRSDCFNDLFACYLLAFFVRKLFLSHAQYLSRCCLDTGNTQTMWSIRFLFLARWLLSIDMRWRWGRHLEMIRSYWGSQYDNVSSKRYIQGCWQVLSPTRKETSECFCQNGVNFLHRLALH